MDGINVLDDDFNYVISQTDAFVIGQNVSFEENKMHIGFLIYQLTEGEDHTIQFCFNGLNMSDHTLEGSWKYTYEAKRMRMKQNLNGRIFLLQSRIKGKR